MALCPPQDEDEEGDKPPCSRHCYKDILDPDNCLALAGGISLLLSSGSKWLWPIAPSFREGSQSCAVKVEAEAFCRRSLGSLSSRERGQLPGIQGVWAIGCWDRLPSWLL